MGNFGNFSSQFWKPEFFLVKKLRKLGDILNPSIIPNKAVGLGAQSKLST